MKICNTFLLNTEYSRKLGKIKNNFVSEELNTFCFVIQTQYSNSQQCVICFKKET